MAVGRSVDDRFGGEITGRSRTVLDNEGLAETLGKPLSDQACGDVRCAAGRIADDHAHRPLRIGLRERMPRPQER